MIFFHSIIAVFILFTFCDFPISRACYLQGSASGECTTKSLDPAWKLANIPFCGGVTLYPICVPKTQVSLKKVAILSFIILLMLFSLVHTRE